METKIKRIAFTADGKRKSTQITLRNILADQLIDNNFVSLQSERIGTTQRPKTSTLFDKKVYNDRIRQRLYPQSAVKSKANLQIRLSEPNQENRLVRNKSENLRQISPSKQKQSQSYRPIFVSKDQKLKMKKCLGKINLIANKQVSLKESEQIELIFEFLECLSINENFYQEAFGYLSEKLKCMIFMFLDDMEPQTVINFRKVAEISNNKQIISSIYQGPNERISYKQLIKEYVDQIIHLTEKAHSQKGYTQNRIEQCLQLIEQKDDLIKKLTQKLNYYQSHPSQNKYPQLIELKQQNQRLKNQMDQLLYKNRVINHNLELLHETNLMLQNKVEALKREIINYELEKQSNLNKVEKSSELKQFEDNVTMLKQMLDRSIIRMSGMKDEYDKLKQYNSTIIEQRDKLARRAAVGFSELTPRPNLKKIFQSHNMNFNEVFDIQQNQKTESSSKKSQKKLPSTQKFVDTLLGKFKNYYETYRVQQKQRRLDLQQSLKKNKKGQKQKQKQKDLYDIALDEAQITKNFIKKTLQSVEEVKIAYHKKQQELLKK